MHQQYAIVKRGGFVLGSEEIEKRLKSGGQLVQEILEKRLEV